MSGNIFQLEFTSVTPYFVIMTLLWLEAALIQSVVPFYKRSSAQELSDRNHYAQLDGLRGLLALGVFFHHALCFHYWVSAGIWQVPPSTFYSQLGTAPVALFFMLTAFLFWTKAQKRGSVGSLHIFFYHRLRRTYPAYLALIVTVALIVVTTFPTDVIHSPSALARQALTYLTVFLIPGPRFPSSVNVLTTVLWTLGIEWEFYLLLPLLALFARRLRVQLILLTLALVLRMLLPAVSATWPWLKGPRALESFNFYFLSYFSIGMLGAVIRARWNIGKIAASRPASVTVIVFLAIVMFLVPGRPGVLEGILVGIPFILIVAGNSLFSLLHSKPLILLGQVSYSTYLLHCTVIYLVYKLLPGLSLSVGHPLAFWVVTAFTGVIVVAVAATSYRFIEAPFMHGYGLNQRNAD